MPTIPTNPYDLVVFAINLVLQGMSANQAYKRLQTGISARAQAEGREVTDDELAFLKGMADASERAQD